VSTLGNIIQASDRLKLTLSSSAAPNVRADATDGFQDLEDEESARLV
jgi:hypothetical protein